MTSGFEGDGAALAVNPRSYRRGDVQGDARLEHGRNQGASFCVSWEGAVAHATENRQTKAAPQNRSSGVITPRESFRSATKLGGDGNIPSYRLSN